VAVDIIAEIETAFGIHQRRLHAHRAESEAPGLIAQARQLGVQVGQIAKSLLFLGKDGRFVMLLCPGDRKASSGKIKAALEVKTRMTRPDETLAATGFEPGGVCPFGIDDRILVLVDAELRRYATIYPAAGTSASGVPMTYDQLIEVTGGQAGDFTVAEEASGEMAG